MTPDLARLRELLDKATAGPWECYPGGTTARATVYATTGHVCTCSRRNGNTYSAPVTTEQMQANAALIAAMHEALPSLLAIAEAYAGAPEGEVAVSRHEGGAAVYVTRFNPAEVFKLAGKRVRLVRVPE